MAPKHIPTVQITRLGVEIEPGVSDFIHWASADDGSLWVIKKVMNESEQLAEAVSALLAPLLRVPLPEVAIPVLEDRPGRWWASSGHWASHHWSADRQEELINFEDLGRILALDALVFNAARHDEDLLMIVTEHNRLRLCSIDYAAAWIGSPTDLLARGLTAPQHPPQLTGLRPQRLTHTMREVARLAAQLSEAELFDIICAAEEAVGGLVIETRDALEEVLLVRFAEASAIVEQYIEVLEDD